MDTGLYAVICLIAFYFILKYGLFLIGVVLYSIGEGLKYLKRIIVRSVFGSSSSPA
jgi:hypothetical protein